MIEAYLPRPDELWFRRKMLADEATMAYNRAYGGTVDFPEERWPDWYGRWVAHPEGRYYRYLRESASGEFVGEIAYHFDGEKYLADVIVYAPYRRRGYGAAGLALLCAAAKENGVGVLYGFGSREELCGAGAAALADDVPRLAALLGAPA